MNRKTLTPYGLIMLIALGYAGAVIGASSVNNAVTGNPIGPSGSITTNHCVKFADTQGNVADAGAACGSGSGSVTSVGGTSTGGTLTASGGPVTTTGSLNFEVNYGTSSTTAARGDLAAPLASPTLTGTPAAPTASVLTNTTQIATTAFVMGRASSTAGVNDQSGTTYTAVPGDAGKLIRLTNASAITLTVDTFANQAIPANSIFYVEQGGAGIVTIAGPSINLRAANGATTAAQYDVRAVMNTDLNNWVVW